jgi:hypothetical protein
LQGVGNPHPHAVTNAAIQKGQAVLDIGSGLGIIDSFIAAHAVGEAGSAMSSFPVDIRIPGDYELVYSYYFIPHITSCRFPRTL